MRLLKSGGTRWVILTKKYAIKFPIISTWKSFIQGLLSNLTEGQWKDFQNPHLCPIAYSNRFGLVVIMHRANPITHEGLFWVELEKLYTDINKETECPAYLHREFFEYDALPKNFGYYKGKLVKIDYGV